MCDVHVYMYMYMYFLMVMFTHQDGNTALHVAARESRANCVRALLSHPGIDVNIKNNEGHTAMMVHVLYRCLLHALYFVATAS